MTLQATTGLLSWPVPASAAGTTNSVTVQVHDDGRPQLKDTRTFKVIVAQPAGLKLAVELRDGPQIQLQLSGDVGQTYLIESSTDLRNWQTFTNFVSTAPVTVFDEPAPLPASQRFYRALAP